MKKHSLPKLIALVGAFVSAALFVIWWALGPTTVPASSIKWMAVKAASGDSNTIVAIQAFGSRAVPDLEELLQYQEPFWKRQVWALAPRLPPRFSKALLARAGPISAPRARVSGAKCLGMLGPQAESAVPALLGTFHDPEAYVAMEAATALAKIGKASIPGLTQALSDKTPVVRHAAAYALGEIGPEAESAVPELIAALKDQDSQVRSSTAYSLMLIGTPTVAALSNVIDHGDANARDAAVREFIRFYRSLRTIVPPLLKMAHAEPAGSRRTALETLGAIRAADDATITTLIGALQDPDVDVRLAAARALGQVPWRAQAAIAPLSRSLQDPSASVRASAAQALGAIGSPARRALTDLRTSLQDKDASVRSAAQEALDKIDPQIQTDRK
jgi:HEAT repeat protein